MVTTTSTATSAVQTATKSLLTSLGSGSGVDTATLVTSLVEAQFAAKTAQLTARADKLTAQISGASSIRSAVTGFATALDTLAKGGTLRTQPKSGTEGVAIASVTGTGPAPSLAASVRVDRLATAQTAASTRLMAGTDPATRTTVLGSGDITINLGTAQYATDGAGTTTMTDFATANPARAVTFRLENATVDTLAAAINKQAASLGVTASVVTGTNGETFLALRGATGTAQAFTLSVDGDAGLGQVAVGRGSAVTAKAQNARLALDGVPVERATNSVDDLVAGVKLDLAGTGTTQLSITRPTAALTQAVEDVVATYNEVYAILKEQTDATTGKLYGDSAAASLLRQLKAMTLAALNPNTGGAPSTLAEIGVRTARDGTLSVDKTTLVVAMAKNPDAVEAMFQPAAASSTGLPALLRSISAAATSTTTGLGASTARYTEAKSAIATDQTKVTDASAALNKRLTAQFTAMNTRVSAYKATQSFLTNQIAAWNKSDS